MHVLFRLSQIISPPTHLERITIFLCSDLKGIDPKEYFCKPFTLKNQGILNREMREYQDGKPSSIRFIQRLIKRLGRETQDGTYHIQLKAELPLDFSPQVDPATLTLAVMYQLIEDKQENKAALLFQAQTENLQNQLYLKMATGKHAPILYTLGKEFKTEQKQFFLEGALSLFLNANDATGVLKVAMELAQSAENIKALTKAIKGLVAKNISLSIIKKAFKDGHAPPFMMDHINSLQVCAFLKRREFKEAISLAKTLSAEKTKDRALKNIIFALTDLSQLAAHPELLTEGTKEKLKSVLTIGIGGRWYAGVELPFTKQIKEARQLLPLFSNQQIKKVCEGYIKKGDDKLLK